MAQSQQFSLLWDAHKKSICSGLSALQQNGEFVDMTLAADGHMVKVHQVIIALASPYLKELISSAQCPHPVIILNKISYTTLCSILEYIYTGEAMVAAKNLTELLAAGKELHIRGLQEMYTRDSFKANNEVAQNVSEPSSNIENMDDEICYFQISNHKNEVNQTEDSKGVDDSSRIPNTEEMVEEYIEDDSIQNAAKLIINKAVTDKNIKPTNSGSPTVMQYTVSNQGSLQMILNRYVYYLKHATRNNKRQWRCVDYVSNVKCPAHVFTKDDFVLQRVSAHIHPFHDKRIMKKVRAGAIFSAISDAQKHGPNVAKKLDKE